MDATVARRSGDREPLDPRRIIPNHPPCLPFVRGIAVYWLYSTLSYCTVVLAGQPRASCCLWDWAQLRAMAVSFLGFAG
jgi:hypothetical protein